MKLNSLLFTSLAMLSLATVGQTEKQPIKEDTWHNPINYKQEIIESIKKSPFLKTSPSFLLQRSATDVKAVARPTFPDFEFVNGINMAWDKFSSDIGYEVTPTYTTEYHPNWAHFSNVFESVANSGGNVVRWWFHTDGATSPVFDKNDEFVVENPDFFLTDLKTLLDLAVEKKIKVQICLWSFDMLKGGPGRWRVNSARNKKILTSDAHLQAYLDNSLVPLVKAIGNHPGLYAWELFNEPEGMTTEYASHWPDFTDKVSITDIQKTVNKMASAIRNAQPGVKITNGALGFISGVDNLIFGYHNNYTDARLAEKGGKSDGYLDFYNIHYYDWAKESGSPFHNTFASTNLDKPTIIAEYYPQDTFGVTVDQLGPELINKGWHGTLVWSWTDKGWDAMKKAVKSTTEALDEITLNISDFSSLESKISIYPNPVVEAVNITSISKKISEITICDIAGNHIFNKKLNGAIETTIDLTRFLAGTYIISLKSANVSKVLKKKFVKI
ncbi:T9SS type A sorting domain-containing protein [Aquimarina agarilytica]|uniref:T9SS type A sorting domain-containing protein n=1 Tax=Aquimarina agarilytica TaxID=1087449 RepID=UPI0002883C17|nr:T9SS type A sorting domain-containing protein [Aquimarina agarilytica]